MSVPIAPETVTAPAVLMVRLEALPLATPETVVMLIGVDAPAPTVNVLPSETVIAPMVIWPVEAPPTVESPVTETPVLLSPNVMTAVPAADTVPFTVTLLGAVAITPPVKAIVSPPLPKAKVPVFAKVVVPAMLFVPPLIATL